jgi:hypothetical protein
MGRNALLEAPIVSDLTPAGSYHRTMDGNGPLRQALAPPGWHQPYPAAPAPPPAPNRRWLPAAILSAGIIVAGGLVGGAVIMNNGAKTDTANVAGAPAGQPAVAAAPGAAESSTCKAWATTRGTLGLIPALPQGWNWDTPNIDTLIGNYSRATNAALDLFIPKIAPQPADVAGAATDYVEGRRNALKMLAEHTYTTADGVAGNEAGFRLTQLCGQQP